MRIPMSRGAVSLALMCVSYGLAAQVVVPSFPNTSPIPSTFAGLVTDQWYVGGNQTIANSLVDATATSVQNRSASTLGSLAAASAVASAPGVKTAAASASVDATTLRVGATSANTSPTDTLSAATAISELTFAIFRNSSDPITLDLHLTGTLSVSGQRSILGTDPSRAGVAVSALGSIANGTSADYSGLYTNVGIDPNLTGSAALAQFAAWPTTTQRNLATFGALATASPTQIFQQVDTHFSVTADPSRADCGTTPVWAVCGSNVYWFHLFVLGGAQNGAVADLTHTLKVDDIRILGGNPIVFTPGQEIQVLSVPEPSSVCLLIAGLVAIGLLATARPRRSEHALLC